MSDIPRILVTGASGALGGALLGLPGAAGISRRLGPWRQADTLAGDWLRPEEAEATILHAAGASTAVAEDATEPQAHLAMVAALLSRGWRGRLVFLSSAAVYGAAPIPVPETAPTQPLNPYGAAKLAVERGLQALLPTERLLILRLANIYGTPLDLSRRRVAALILDALRRGTPFTTYGPGTSERDYLHVADFRRAVERAVTVGQGILNIGSGEGTTLNALIAAAEALTHRRLNRREEPERAEAAACVLDITRARSLVGWQPEIPLTRGLQSLLGTLPS